MTVDFCLVEPLLDFDEPDLSGWLCSLLTGSPAITLGGRDVADSALGIGWLTVLPTPMRSSKLLSTRRFQLSTLARTVLSWLNFRSQSFHSASLFVRSQSDPTSGTSGLLTSILVPSQRPLRPLVTPILSNRVRKTHFPSEGFPWAVAHASRTRSHKTLLQLSSSSSGE